MYLIGDLLACSQGPAYGSSIGLAAADTESGAVCAVPSQSKNSSEETATTLDHQAGSGKRRRKVAVTRSFSSGEKVLMVRRRGREKQV